MQNDTAAEPDWATPLRLTITPALLIHALFGTSNSVHTGWESCIDDTLVLGDLMAMDESTGNYCRMVEQEYTEEEDEEAVWHDWTVELRIGTVTITGHWQIQTVTPPMDWEWCAREAEKAFEKACVLLGKRIRRGIGVDELSYGPEAPNGPTH